MLSQVICVFFPFIWDWFVHYEAIVLNIKWVLSIELFILVIPFQWGWVGLISIEPNWRGVCGLSAPKFILVQIGIKCCREILVVYRVSWSLVLIELFTFQPHVSGSLPCIHGTGVLSKNNWLHCQEKHKVKEYRV